ncbi:hypothetical protein CR513_19005, partial [Mucuna pruriens]
MVLALCRIYLRTTKDTNHLFPTYANINWSIGYHYESTIVQRFLTDPFSNRYQSISKCKIIQARKYKMNDELLQTFSKIPKYAKFLKELCTNKRKKLKGDVEMGRHVSALIKSKQLATTKKCRDPNTFTIPCTIGKCTFDIILDLGASISVMLSSVYRSLRLGALEPTSVVIQLANRSIAHTHLTFWNICWCKPFLKTTRTKIDMHARTLSMEFGDNMVEYNIFKAMKHLTENHSVFNLDMIDQLEKSLTQFMQLSMSSQKNMNALIKNLKVQLGIWQSNWRINQVKTSWVALNPILRSNVSIPFAKALEQMPTYVKFMKELLIKKQIFKEDKNVALSEEYSAILQRKLPSKLKDPGSFTIPCTIENLAIRKALCDLGESTNLMPLSMLNKIREEI